MRGSPALGQIHRPEILYPQRRKWLDLPPFLGILLLAFLQKPRTAHLFRQPGTGRRVQACTRSAPLCRAPEDQ